MSIESAFKKNLREWYRVNGRHALPWRLTRDPYHILVSEVMLQQTQVERVIPKYLAFLKRFGTSEKLARASGASVLRAWKGMGYNRRALFLKKCAEACMREYKGQVPDTYEALRKLPGVGDYTARAVLSFAFGRSGAFWDTNIRRIFSRLYFGKNPSAVSDKHLERVIVQNAKTASTPRHHALAYDGGAAYHGALMDFGSAVCRPKPLCSICPMRKFCKAAPKVLESGWQALEGRVVRHPQSKFEGSDRKVRGAVINFLRAEKYAGMGAIGASVREPEVRIKNILQTLLRDGLIIKKGSIYQLPA